MIKKLFFIFLIALILIETGLMARGVDQFNLERISPVDGKTIDELRDNLNRWILRYVQSNSEKIEQAIKSLQGSSVPVGTILPVMTNMTGCPFPATSEGWALCNGTTAASQGISNPVITGTLPNLNGGVFVRGSSESWVSGSVSGGSDTHTHAVDVGSTTSSGGSAHSHGAGTLQFVVARLESDNDMYFYKSNGTEENVFIATNPGGGLSSGTYISLNQNLTLYTASGAGSTANESAHTHTVDPASVTSGSGSNIPQYYGVVYFIKAK